MATTSSFHAAAAIDIRILPVQLSLLTDNRDPWLRRFAVPSATVSGRTYTVALHRQGHFGCSCSGWIYHRAECKHIQAVKARLGEGRPS